MGSVESGRVFAGRYRLVTRLGRGGFGEVWSAEDTVLERQVAVKTLIVSAGATTCCCGSSAKRCSHCGSLKADDQRVVRSPSTAAEAGVLDVSTDEAVASEPSAIWRPPPGPSVAA